MLTRDEGSSANLKSRSLKLSDDGGVDNDKAEGMTARGGASGGATTTKMRLKVTVLRRYIRRGLLVQGAIVKISLNSEALAKIRHLALVGTDRHEAQVELAYVQFRSAPHTVYLKTSQTAKFESVEVHGWTSCVLPMGNPPVIAPDAKGKLKVIE